MCRTVVREKEMLMTAPTWRSTAQRKRLLDVARDLARSGQHPDHTSVIAELEAMEGFAEARGWFEGSAMRLQLNRLCAVAQMRPARIDIPGR
jgi:hypothetical protein